MPVLMFYSLAGFLILFIILEVIPLSRKREWKRLIIPVILFSLIMLYGIDYGAGLDLLPNPNEFLYYFKPFSESFERILEVN